jgi:hypothetical protein
LKTRKAAGVKSQADNDADGMQAILEAIPDGKSMPKRKLRTATGMGDSRLSRLLALIVKDGKLNRRSARRKGSRQKVELYSRVGTDDGTDVGIDQ